MQTTKLFVVLFVQPSPIITFLCLPSIGWAKFVRQHWQVVSLSHFSNEVFLVSAAWWPLEQLFLVKAATLHQSKDHLVSKQEAEKDWIESCSLLAIEPKVDRQVHVPLNEYDQAWSGGCRTSLLSDSLNLPLMVPQRLTISSHRSPVEKDYQV